MAPKLQSKTLETKAQTCPLYEAKLPQKAVAGSSGQAVPARVAGIRVQGCQHTALGLPSLRVLLPHLPEDPLTPVSQGSTLSTACCHSSNV